LFKSSSDGVNLFNFQKVLLKFSTSYRCKSRVEKKIFKIKHAKIMLNQIVAIGFDLKQYNINQLYRLKDKTNGAN